MAYSDIDTSKSRDLRFPESIVGLARFRRKARVHTAYSAFNLAITRTRVFQTSYFAVSTTVERRFVHQNSYTRTTLLRDFAGKRVHKRHA